MSTKEKTAETDEAPAKGGKKKLILILLVVLLAAAGAAYFFLFTGSARPRPRSRSPASVLTLEPIAVNLAGGGYLKIGVTLRAHRGAQRRRPRRQRGPTAPRRPT